MVTEDLGGIAHLKPPQRPKQVPIFQWCKDLKLRMGGGPGREREGGGETIIESEA